MKPLRLTILSVIYFLEVETVDSEEESRRSDRKSRSGGKESKNKESSRTKSKGKEESGDDGTSNIY